MVDLRQDPVLNAIENGIKRGIQIAFDYECLGAAIILIYAGMDSMAYLDMPKKQTYVKKADFIRWAESYIRFSCQEQLSGADLYGARCSTLHAYGVVSKMSTEGKCRILSYKNKGEPAVQPGGTAVIPGTANRVEVVIVSLKALKESFFKGIDDFLDAAFANSAKAKIVNARLQTLIQTYSIPAKPPSS